MTAGGCRFEEVAAHVDRLTPDDRTDRPVLGAIRGRDGTLLIEGGASPAHLRLLVDELERRGRPPIVGIALTHWHWDHSFGSAAVDVPVIASRGTADALAVQRSYEWSDAALDKRVADGREIAFCRDMLRLEMPDRSALEIVLPTAAFDEEHAIDLGGVRVELRRVGGDHAEDSVVAWVPEDGVLFLGDALYERLYAPEPHLTPTGVRGLLERLDGLAPVAALEGHDEGVAGADAYAARLADLERACAIVEAGDAAPTDDPSLVELVGLLRIGAGLS
jgi:glyoxylase-like metal-dependent hydrolase (beta-lactamase superfamily II)